MNQNFSKTLKGAVVATDDFYNLLQELAVFSLKEAKDGNVDYANQLIRAFLKPSFFHPGYIIAWFERFGMLKWCNDTERLVISGGGRWLIGGAMSTKWYDTPLSCVYRLSFKQIDVNNKSKIAVTKDNFGNKMRDDSKKISITDQIYGKFGVAADKIRYRKYKIRSRHK